MEPITLGFIGGFLLTSFISYKIGRRTEHNLDPKKIEVDNLTEQVTHYKREQESMTYRVQSLNNYCTSYQTAVATLTTERDRWKAAAMTHDIKWPDPPAPKTETRKVWNARRYSNHPGDNLKALAADLKQFEGKEVTLLLDLQATGGWVRIFQNKQVNTTWKGWKFQGPPARVIDEINCVLQDHDHPFMSILKADSTQHPHTKGKFDQPLVWNDIDSPVTWDVSMDVTETMAPAAKPEVITVEIGIPESKVIEVEKVVEKIVEVEKKVAVVADPAELATLVELAVDEQLRRRAEHRVAAISESRMPPPPKVVAGG